MRIDREDRRGLTGPLCLLVALTFLIAAYLGIQLELVWLSWLPPLLLLIWLGIGGLALWQRQYGWIAASLMLVILPGGRAHTEIVSS